MAEKIKILAESLKDERSKKVIFVAHCVLNENTRYLGGAFRKGCIDEIVDEIQHQGIGIVQMKCPEQKAWGGVLKKFMCQPIGSKSTLLYKLRGVFLPFFIWNTKRMFRKIAKEVVAEIKDYRGSDFEVVGVIGIAGSPSCGVHTTLDMKKSFEFLANTDIGELDSKKMNESGMQELLIKGRGFFIKALQDELAKANLTVKFYEHDLVAEAMGKKIEMEFK